MAYFKINNNDYSSCVNSLKITKNRAYTAQTNAAGDTVADYINTKRVIEVGIIPLDADTMASLQNDLDNFNVVISCRNPQTDALEDNIKCIIPTSGIDYYTIRADRVMYKAFVLVFNEL